MNACEPISSPALRPRRLRWPWYVGAGAIACIVIGTAFILAVGRARDRETPNDILDRGDKLKILETSIVGTWVDAENDQESLQFEKERLGPYGMRLRCKNTAFPAAQALLLYDFSSLRDGAIDIHFRDIYPEEGFGISKPKLGVTFNIKQPSHARVLLTGRKFEEDIEVVFPRWVKLRAPNFEVHNIWFEGTVTVSADELSLTMIKTLGGTALDTDGKTYKYRKTR